jgi:hypothetical protein
MRQLFLIPLAIPLSGCVIGTVADAAVTAVTLPVKVVAAGVDAATTSQSEADQKRGRSMRKAEEAYGRRLHDWQAQCAKDQAQGLTCAPRPEFVPPQPR